MVRLPETFTNRMREMLGEEEFEEFLASYDRPREYGLRLNRLKGTPEELKGLLPWNLTPIPWIDNGFSYSGEVRPARHPLYAAGVYYLQEPSAMTPASRLDICPGDKVLDLCAAPGGKATELAAKLGGSGLLVANDISNSRAKALLHNLELFGASNIFVTNETPERLEGAFPDYFDKVLVDAPCSGEGMFRKEEAVIGTWSPERTEWFAGEQRRITDCAVRMLRPGGLMLYSTCTFAPCEDEGTVSWLLGRHPELELLSPAPYEGFSRGIPAWGDGNPELKKCVRIWPHKMTGEGHFMALFHKKAEESGIENLKEEGRNCGENPKNDRKDKKKKGKKERVKSKEQEAGFPKEEQKIFESFLSSLSGDIFPGLRAELRGEKVFLVPQLPDTVRGLRFLRCGLYAGDLKKNRFEPSCQLAHAIPKGAYPCRLDLDPEDERTERFLKGETLVLTEEESRQEAGWKLVTAAGYPLGWGKLTGGILKNHYPVSWRNG